jgi:hypothetical protein
MSTKRFRQTAAPEAIRRSAHDGLLCIREGITDGTFRQDANAYLVRSMLPGTIEHLFIHWHMQGRPESKTNLVDLLDPFLEIVFSGIRAKKEEAGLTLRLDVEGARTLGAFLQTQGGPDQKDGESSQRENERRTIKKPKTSKKKGATP